MKKLSALVLAILLALTCVAFAEAADVTGLWYLSSVELNGAILNPASTGMETTMELNEDGTALIKMTEEEDITANWTLEGDEITMSGDVMNPDGEEPTVFKIVDDTLLFEDEDMKMTFAREAPSAFVASPVREDATLAEFDGEWVAVLMDVMGMQVDPAMFDMQIKATIADGNVSFAQTISGEENAFEAQGTFEGYTLTIADPAAEGDTPATMSFVLREDGTMSYDVPDMGSVYFEKAVAE